MKENCRTPINIPRIVIYNLRTAGAFLRGM